MKSLNPKFNIHHVINLHGTPFTPANYPKELAFNFDPIMAYEYTVSGQLTYGNGDQYLLLSFLTLYFPYSFKHRKITKRQYKLMSHWYRHNEWVIIQKLESHTLASYI